MHDFYCSGVWGPLPQATYGRRGSGGPLTTKLRARVLTVYSGILRVKGWGQGIPTRVSLLSIRSSWQSWGQGFEPPQLHQHQDDVRQASPAAFPSYAVLTFA